METQTKTPVEIVQELLAIQTTRKEAVEKITSKKSADELPSKIQTIHQQSEDFISELMNELSDFGDGVQAEAGRENEYQQIWKRALPDLDNMNAADLTKIFEDMEGTLKTIYHDLIETKAELPVSLKDIINSQSDRLTGSVD